MTMPHRIAAAALCLALLHAPARAATLDGVTLPDSYDFAGQRLVLNGIGVRTLTILAVRVYVAGLYLAQKSQNAEQILRSTTPKVLVLQFLHAGSKEQIERQYRAGMAQNCGHGECDPADRADYDQLIAAAPGVKPGDTSTYQFSNGRVVVFANQTKIGDFANQDLSYHLLEGFLGSHPPSQELKDSLLGLPAR